jgi:phenolic acid decarboxylase
VIINILRFLLGNKNYQFVSDWKYLIYEKNNEIISYVCTKIAVNGRGINIY